MSQGVQVFNAAGALVWDSSNVAGGVIADIKTYESTNTAILTYPAFAGRSASIITLLSWIAASTDGVSVDYALGYPRITVSAASTTRKFAVVVF